MSWKSIGPRHWQGTGVDDGFRIEYVRSHNPSEYRSVYYVYHQDVLLGVARTRPGANHCVDEHSRMLLFQRLRINEPHRQPALLGSAIWFQGRVLRPDEDAGFNWVYEGDFDNEHRKIECWDWEEAWGYLTRRQCS